MEQNATVSQFSTQCLLALAFLIHQILFKIPWTSPHHVSIPRKQPTLHFVFQALHLGVKSR